MLCYYGICKTGNYSSVFTQDNFIPLLPQFGEWWAPLITVTVLGGVFAFFFLLAGGIFLCCRCCGACGGGRSKSEPQDIRMFVITVLLVLVALVLL